METNNATERNRNTFSLIFSNVGLKTPYKQFLLFLSFINTFLIFLLKLSSNHIAMAWALVEV